VADGAGGNSETSRALLLRGDLAIFPCKASMLEARALAQATSLLHQARDIRGAKPDGVVVLSMVGKQYRLTQDMREIAAELKLRITGPALTLRQIYADAPGQGSVVWRMGTRGKEAAAEVLELFETLLPNAVADRRTSRKAARPQVTEFEVM
jgi:chromosome partitioning protein